MDAWSQRDLEIVIREATAPARQGHGRKPRRPHRMHEFPPRGAIFMYAVRTSPGNHRKNGKCDVMVERRQAVRRIGYGDEAAGPHRAPGSLQHRLRFLERHVLERGR